MKKTITLLSAIVFLGLTATSCSREKIVIPGVIVETTVVAQIETVEQTDQIEDSTESSNNSKNRSRAVVEVMGNDEILFSIDFLKTTATKFEVTLDEPIQDGYLYVAINGGGVTNHSLESDGSLSDGIVYVEDGKAEFTVEYGGEVVSFVFNVPANLPADMPMA